MSINNPLAGWDTERLDRLVEAVVGGPQSDLYRSLRGPVRDTRDLRWERPLESNRSTYKADMLTCMYDRSSKFIISRPKAPASLSPVIWMEHRSRYYTNGDLRQRDRQIRNHLLRQRYVKRWNFRFIRPDNFAELIAQPDHSIATPEERLKVLPQVLWNIRQKFIRLCLIEDSNQLDFFRAETFGADWQVGIHINPATNEPRRETFEASDAREEVNRAIVAQVCEQYFGKRDLAARDLTEDEFHKQIVAYSEKTIGECLKAAMDRIHDRPSLRDVVERVGAAIEDGQPFADCRDLEEGEQSGEQVKFDVANGYRYVDGDEETMETYLLNLVRSFGIEIDIRKPPPPAPGLEIDKVQCRLWYRERFATLYPADMAMFVHLINAPRRTATIQELRHVRKEAMGVDWSATAKKENGREGDLNSAKRRINDILRIKLKSGYRLRKSGTQFSLEEIS